MAEMDVERGRAVQTVAARYTVGRFLEFYLLELSLVIDQNIDVHKEVVAVLGVSRETYREWLKGNGSPSPQQLLKLDAHYGLKCARMYLQHLIDEFQGEEE